MCSICPVCGPKLNKVGIVPPIDLKSQSVENPNGGGGRVNRLVEGGNLVEYMFEDARTLYQAFERGRRISKTGPGNCLGSRKDASSPFHWISYEEVMKRAEYVAAGMIGKQLEIGQSSFIGIYSQNRPEWIMAQLACYLYSMVPVPLYDTLGADSCDHIISMTHMELVFCDTNSKALGLLARKEKYPTLNVIVVFVSELSSDVLEKVTEGISTVDVLTFDDLERFGCNIPESERIPKTTPSPEDLAIVCFTSGTTGPPKGAMITHRNMMAELSLPIQIKNFPVSPEDTLISFLPLAHMFEQLLEWLCFLYGAKVGYFRGDIKLLTDDLMELKPTLLPVVPRILNRIYDRSMQLANKNCLNKWLMRKAIKAKRKDLSRMLIRKNSIWDRVIFKKIRAKTGDRVRIMLTGSAPISAEVLTFIRCCMACLVLEGYGQTESCGGATITTEGDSASGHVGPPAIFAEVKLLDVAEMDYWTRNQQGEILVRGPSVFKGYYKDEEKTREVLGADGWLHTGDIGQWTDNGCLKIIDRKKNIFKLAQGEFVAPEKIENVYVRSRYVSQVFVDGRSLKASLVGIVVPDPEVIVGAAQKELGIKGMAIQELCREESVKKMIAADMKALADDEGLNSFEQVKDIYLTPEQFTVENGLLTPTLKSIRSKLSSIYEQELNRMYDLLA